MYWKSNRITPSQSFKNLLNLNFLVCYRPFKFSNYVKFELTHIGDIVNPEN